MQAKDILHDGPKNPIQNINLFALFPKLFVHFHPSLTWTLKDIRSRENADKSSDGRALSQEPFETISQPEEEDKSQLQEPDKVALVDCFFFLMMAFNNGTEVRSSIEQEFREHENRKPSGVYNPSQQGSGNLKKYFVAVSNNIKTTSRLPKIFSLIAKIVSRERKMIIGRLRDILRARLSVETITYSRSMPIIEVAILSQHRTGRKVHQFFKMFALNPESSLIDILMISPENISNLCRF